MGERARERAMLDRQLWTRKWVRFMTANPIFEVLSGTSKYFKVLNLEVPRGTETNTKEQRCFLEHIKDLLEAIRCHDLCLHRCQ